MGNFIMNKNISDYIQAFVFTSKTLNTSGVKILHKKISKRNLAYVWMAQ